MRIEPLRGRIAINARWRDAVQELFFIVLNRVDCVVCGDSRGRVTTTILHVVPDAVQFLALGLERRVPFSNEPSAVGRLLIIVIVGRR
ncbi:hypothetical protein BDD21_0198 [Thiocapsa rosea]|uniref:Uncharacterized protein n=1 Tax=Thiocapsa rosea TaxID=69360 RepID=A0A495V0B4_9GAMM|nr:hypothetical protein BDD21_0198 [Thiocapsa rosea]